MEEKIGPLFADFVLEGAKMCHPTTRLLTMLELVQTHAYLSGEELASRLEVELRTVRRYVLMLQEMGMPVESIHGPVAGSPAPSSLLLRCRKCRCQRECCA